MPCLPASSTMHRSTYLYMLCDYVQCFHVARVVFQVFGEPHHIPLDNRDHINQGHVFFFVLHFELAPFSDGQPSKVSARNTVFTWETYWARICTTVVYTTRRHNNLLYDDIMRKISRVYTRSIGETGNEGKPTPQPSQHDEVMNQSFQTDERTSWGRLSRVYIYRRGGKWAQTKTTTTATWRNESPISNGSMNPHHTSRSVYFH